MLDIEAFEISSSFLPAGDTTRVIVVISCDVHGHFDHIGVIGLLAIDTVVSELPDQSFPTLMEDIISGSRTETLLAHDIPRQLLGPEHPGERLVIQNYERLADCGNAQTVSRFELQKPDTFSRVATRHLPPNKISNYAATNNRSRRTPHRHR